MTDHAKSSGAKGLAYIRSSNGEWKSPIVKFFNDAEKASLTRKLAVLKEGDLILFAADQWLTAVRNPRKDSPLLRRVLKGQGKLRIDRSALNSLGGDFSAVSFDKEQNRWYSASSVHCAGGG